MFKTAAEELPDTGPGDGSVPCHPPSRRRARRLSSPRPSSPGMATAPEGRPALPSPTHPVQGSLVDLFRLTRPLPAYREPAKKRGEQAIEGRERRSQRRRPTSLVSIHRLGRTLKQRVLRPSRSHQRPARTPPRLRPRLPLPHELHPRRLLEARGFRPHNTPPNAVSVRCTPCTLSQRTTRPRARSADAHTATLTLANTRDPIQRHRPHTSMRSDRVQTQLQTRLLGGSGDREESFRETLESSVVPHDRRGLRAALSDKRWRPSLRGSRAAIIDSLHPGRGSADQ